MAKQVGLGLQQVRRQLDHRRATAATHVAPARLDLLDPVLHEVGLDRRGVGLLQAADVDSSSAATVASRSTGRRVLVAGPEPAEVDDGGAADLAEDGRRGRGRHSLGGASTGARREGADLPGEIDQLGSRVRGSARGRPRRGCRPGGPTCPCRSRCRALATPPGGKRPLQGPPRPHRASSRRTGTGSPVATRRELCDHPRRRVGRPCRSRVWRPEGRLLRHLGILAAALALGDRPSRPTSRWRPGCRARRAPARDRAARRADRRGSSPTPVAPRPGRPGEGDEEPNAGQRALDVAKAALYLGLAYTAVRLLTGDGGGGSGGQDQAQSASGAS